MPETVSTAYQGWVDEAAPKAIAGWVNDPRQPNDPLFIDIAINGEKMASLKAALFREDLRRLGFGDGRKAFFFNPLQYLRPGHNAVRISYADTGEPLPNGNQVIVNLAGDENGERGSEADLLELSQTRWRGDEEDYHLTWRSIMTGDSFVDVVLRHRAFAGEETILEVGPGYGRLLLTLLQRQIPFAKYVGLEISAARVEKLARKFQPATIGRVGPPQGAEPALAAAPVRQRRPALAPALRFLARVKRKVAPARHARSAKQVEFVHADILRDTVDCRADVVICSSTIEHLFPSMENALHNFHKMSRVGTQLFIDFIRCDDGLQTARAYFEPSTAYIRTYSRSEIESMFAQAGFRVQGLENIVLGKDDQDQEVRRTLVIANREG